MTRGPVHFRVEVSFRRPPQINSQPLPLRNAFSRCNLGQTARRRQTQGTQARVTRADSTEEANEQVPLEADRWIVWPVCSTSVRHDSHCLCGADHCQRFRYVSCGSSLAWLTACRQDKPAKLDHLLVQPYLGSVPVLLGANHRCFRSPCCRAKRHHHHDDRLGHLHRRPDVFVSGPASRSSHSRHRMLGRQHLHPYHSRRQGIASGLCSELDHFRSHIGRGIWRWPADRRLPHTGFVAVVLRHQPAHLCGVHCRRLSFVAKGAPGSPASA